MAVTRACAFRTKPTRLPLVLGQLQGDCLEQPPLVQTCAVVEEASLFRVFMRAHSATQFQADCAASLFPEGAHCCVRSATGVDELGVGGCWERALQRRLPFPLLPGNGAARAGKGAAGRARAQQGRAGAGSLPLALSAVPLLGVRDYSGSCCYAQAPPAQRGSLAWCASH